MARRCSGRRAGAPHQRVDVPVEVAVQHVRRAGGQRAAHQRRHRDQRTGQPALRQHHRRHGDHQQQFDDPWFGECEVVGEHHPCPAEQPRRYRRRRCLRSDCHWWFPPTGRRARARRARCGGRLRAPSGNCGPDVNSRRAPRFQLRTFWISARNCAAVVLPITRAAIRPSRSTTSVLGMPKRGSTVSLLQYPAVGVEQVRVAHPGRPRERPGRRRAVLLVDAGEGDALAGQLAGRPRQGR